MTFINYGRRFILGLLFYFLFYILWQSSGMASSGPHAINTLAGVGSGFLACALCDLKEGR